MLDLIFLVLCSWARLAAQEPQDEPLAALGRLLDEPRTNDQEWRVAVWEHLTQLEHAASPRVLEGWQALAQAGGDADLANLFLYQRRHALPRLPQNPDDGPELTLERCLAAWGDRDFAAAESRLRQALERFPDDTRLRENLWWLRVESPEPILLDGSARHLALAVLAARETRG